MPQNGIVLEGLRPSLSCIDIKLFKQLQQGEYLSIVMLIHLLY
jgi:hypothetical protein